MVETRGNKRAMELNLRKSDVVVEESEYFKKTYQRRVSKARAQ